jgi:hypothetical protein
MFAARRIELLLVVSMLLSSTLGGWIDSDTPLDKRTTTSLVDGSTYQLVCVCYSIAVSFLLFYIVAGCFVQGSLVLFSANHISSTPRLSPSN